MKRKKLMFSRQTILRLTTVDLGRVAGGIPPEPTVACPNTNSCRVSCRESDCCQVSDSCFSCFDTCY